MFLVKAIEMKLETLKQKYYSQSGSESVHLAMNGGE